LSASLTLGEFFTLSRSHCNSFDALLNNSTGSASFMMLFCWGTGKGLERCFDLVFGVCVHGCICVFSSVSCPALFLHRLQQLYSPIGQPVFLSRTLGRIGLRHLNQILLKRRLKIVLSKGFPIMQLQPLHQKAAIKFPLLQHI